MTNDSITSVGSMSAWATDLTFALYDFSGNVTSANGDITRLAKDVNLLSQVLRQAGTGLFEHGSIISEEATHTVQEILDQCQDVFHEVEMLVPIRDAQLRITSQAHGTAGAQSREQLEWNVLSQSRTQYLRSHMESLRLTLVLLLQTLYTAKIASLARRDWRAKPAVDIQRKQMANLIIEQQLTLLRAYRMYEDFKHQVAHAPLALGQSPSSQALIKRNEYGPNPRALIVYQEPSMARMPVSYDDSEDLANVRSVATPFVDVLLSRWTRNLIDEQTKMIEQQPRDAPRDRVERRNWRASTCESDAESEAEEKPPRPPKLHLSTTDPILMHVNEPRSVSSPIAAPSGGLMPPGGPFSPQPSNSWGPSGSYFPQSPRTAPTTGWPRSSPGPSPLSSPRPSISTEANGDAVQRPRTAFRVDDQAIPQAPSSQPQPQAARLPARPPIPWRIRINQWYWDHLGSQRVYSSVNMSPREAKKTVSKDTQAITEVFREHVSRDALKELDYEWTKITRERSLGEGRKVKDDCYCVEGMLSWAAVEELVEVTGEIRSPQRSPVKTSTSGGPVLPPLDRSNTAPAGILHAQKFREGIRSDAATQGSKTPSVTSSTDEETEYKLHRTRSRSRRDSSSHRRDSSPRRTASLHRSSSRRESSSARKDSGSGERYERNTSRTRRSKSSSYDDDRKDKKKGSMKAQTLSKIAAGAGLATLLDGLPEMLSYL